ncbi:hypothetical protein [Pyxidicoccus parkwayensis]|uniref:hypothetical protein n=1 Tax=Pyxidicoccus parkwayensis TaxID=2813578 RepID=UPI001F509836|nr:hypothetical protein [Pyxidicoccus parkwaysis]
MRFIPSVVRVAMVLLLVAGCGDSSGPSNPNDAGTSDAGRVDAGGNDSGIADAGVDDAGTPDAGGDDAGLPDAGGDDAGTPDAGDDAGTPDSGVPDAGPQDTFILFDPRGAEPVLPEPNDLRIDPDTGRVRLPVRSEDPPAQQEFTRDYINNLDGFVTSSVVGARVSAQLDPSTVNASTVRVMRDDGAAADVEYFVGFDGDSKRLLAFAFNSLRSWGRGTRYVVAVLGGSSGVKDTAGRPVVGSQVWQWVRSTTALVDGSGRSTVTGLSDADASSLEKLRLRYAPYLDRLASQGTRREDVAALWTFTTASFPAVTYAPERSIIPFPSEYFLTKDGSRVNIPTPSGSGPLLSQTLAGLNTLDGFSTTGVIASENSPSEGALDTGLVAPDSLVAGTRFLRLSGTGPAPSVEACLDCASSLRPDGSTQSSPQQLQFVPRLPLDEGTTYAAVITNELLDTAGRPVTATVAWALIRLSVPLIDGQGRSQVSNVADIIAQALEPVRLSLKPTLDALESRGIPRAKVALAFTVHTQSTLSVQARLVQAVRSMQVAPVQVVNESGLLSSLSVPHDQLGGLYEARVPVINLLNGAGGVIDTGIPRQEPARVLLTIPSSPMPASGWPVVLFAHDLSADRTELLSLANELARSGFAAAAMDSIRHGERSNCVGSRYEGNDDNACADASTQRCETNEASESYGRCVARNANNRVDCTQPQGEWLCAQNGLGRCVSSTAGDGRRVCEGGTFRTAGGVLSRPVISGWNMLTPSSPFAMRDNFRQAAVDLDQLVRALRSDELALALGSVKLDGTRLHFVGAGMGAQVGSLFLAVNADVQRAVLNVPAADPMGLLLTSPALASQRASYLASLQAEGFTSGTPGFDTFIQYQRQALDPADAWNAARAVKDHAGAPPGRAVFIQYIAGDAFIPATLTEKFIAAANAGDENRCPVSRWDPAGWPPELRHGFLLHPVGDGTVTTAAQRQAATFLETGTITPPLAGLR